MNNMTRYFLRKLANRSDDPLTRARTRLTAREDESRYIVDTVAELFPNERRPTTAAQAVTVLASRFKEVRDMVEFKMWWEEK